MRPLSCLHAAYKAGSKDNGKNYEVSVPGQVSLSLEVMSRITP